MGSIARPFVASGLLRALVPSMMWLLTGCGDSGPSGDVAALVADVEANARPSTEHVASMARDHDVVLLGEFQHVREDVAFVRAALPALHEAGVRVLGIEYACAEDQARIDAAIAAIMLDTGELAEIQRRYAGGSWAYEDYLGLYTGVWQLNRDLPDGAEKMRVVALSPYVDFEKVHTGDATARREELTKLASADAFMAAVIQREVDAGRKVVALMGTLHALTDYAPPALEEGEVVGEDTWRCGHVLARSLGDRVATVLFHQPLPAVNGGLVLPGGGALDDAFAAAHDSTNSPLGIALAGTGAGALPVPGALGEGRDATLADLADGWVYHAPIARLRGVQIIHDWLQTDDDLERALAHYPDPDAVSEVETIDQMREQYLLDAGIRLRFERLR